MLLGPVIVPWETLKVTELYLSLIIYFIYLTWIQIVILGRHNRVEIIRIYLLVLSIEKFWWREEHLVVFRHLRGLKRIHKRIAEFLVKTLLIEGLHFFIHLWHIDDGRLLEPQQRCGVRLFLEVIWLLHKEILLSRNLWAL